MEEEEEEEEEEGGGAAARPHRRRNPPRAGGSAPRRRGGGGRSKGGDDDGGGGSSSPPVPPGHELVVEGSARMVYPKSENTVFYNPVQVQNRDLSILMISMYAERRARRLATVAKRKELMRAEREGGAKERDVDRDRIDREAEEYAKKKDWREVVSMTGGNGAAVRGGGGGSSSGENGGGGDSAVPGGAVAGLRVLDALAASGLRSIRYWKEIPGIDEVVINDLDEAAVELARENVTYNGLGDALLDSDSPREEGRRRRGIRVRHGDATHEMYLSRRPPGVVQLTPSQLLQRDRYDVIDLDPYGSSAPFLDSAVQSVAHGGLLCVTCTDMAALGGSHPETCYGRYGSMPIQRAGYLQEMALRILLGCTAGVAARYGRTIRPVLSVGMAFYVRVFIEVYDDKAGVNDLSLKIGTVYQSTRCPSYHTVPRGQLGSGKRKNVYQPTRAPPVPECEETGGPFKVGGPAWLGPMHDSDVVDEAVRRLEVPRDGGTARPLPTRERLHGLLTSVSEELPDVPLYYSLPDLCHTLQCQSPPMMKVRAAIVNAGYRVSGYHKEPQAIKTDAPNRVVWDVMRAWCKEHPPKAGGKKGKKKKERREQQKRMSDAGGGGEGGGKADGGAGGEADGANTEGREGNGEGVEAKPLSPGERILAVEPSTEIDFTVPQGFDKRRKARRFPHNPESHWGPKPRAGGFKRKAEASSAAAKAADAEPAEDPDPKKGRTSDDGGES